MNAPLTRLGITRLLRSTSLFPAGPAFIGLFLVGLSLVFSTSVRAQNLLASSESVVFDPDRGRYLVSNYGNGDIVAIDAQGTQTYFNRALTRVCGLHICGGVLYAAASASPYIGVVGLDLATGGIVSYVPMAGSGMINDIASDPGGNLYVTDYYGDKIYKIRPGSNGYSVFVGSGLAMPNGIVYDEAGDRLLTLQESQAPYPMLAVSLVDSTVSTVVLTNLSGLDGIARDDEGNTYVSSWTTNSIHKYGPSLTNPSTVFSSGQESPADIYYDPWNDLIAIPLFYRNQVSFVPIHWAGVDPDVERPLPPLTIWTSVQPTPAVDLVRIACRLDEPSPASLRIWDVAGREVHSQREALLSKGIQEFVWDAAGGHQGTFFYRLEAGRRVGAGKITVLR